MKQSTVINCDEFLPAQCSDGCPVFRLLVAILVDPAAGVESLALMRFQHCHHHVTFSSVCIGPSQIAAAWHCAVVHDCGQKRP